VHVFIGNGWRIRVTGWGGGGGGFGVGGGGGLCDSIILSAFPQDAVRIQVPHSAVIGAVLQCVRLAEEDYVPRHDTSTYGIYIDVTYM